MELLAIWVIMGVVVAMIASSKGKSAGAWFAYGVVVWPIALVHILLEDRPVAVADRKAVETGDFRKCPFCAEVIRREAIVCRHCGRDIPASAAVPTEVRVGGRAQHPLRGDGKVSAISGEYAWVTFDESGEGKVPVRSLVPLPDQPAA